jgi:hypothetical protein
MVIDNFQVRGTERALRPLEANSPPVVDADAVLRLAIPLERAGGIQYQNYSPGRLPVLFYLYLTLTV